MTEDPPSDASPSGDAPPGEHRPLRSFGRTRSRAIKPRQAGLMDSLLPTIALAPAADRST